MKTLRIMLVIGMVGLAAPAAADVADDLREADRYYEEGEYKKAAAAYDGAIRRYPGQVEAEAYAKRATIFVIQKDLEAGLAFIRDKAKKQHPNAAEVLEQEAVILWGLGKKGDAIPIAEKAAASKPSAFAAQLLIGDFYSARDPQKTATAYEAYLQYRPGDQESKDVFPRIRLGHAYLAVGNTAFFEGRGKDGKVAFESAKKQFETLKKKHSKAPHASLNADIGLCAAYTGLEDFDKAITICETVVRNPKQVDSRASAWFNLGKSYLQKKQAGRARTAATEYNKLRGTEARGYILMGDAYLLEKNYDLALQNYQNAEGKLKPDQRKIKVNLSIKMGETYLALPKPDVANAISKLEDGRDANPDDPALAANLGKAYLLNKQDNDALTTTDRLVKGKGFTKLTESQRISLLLVSGKALYNTKKYKESRERFEAAYAIRKSDVEIKKRLVQVIEIQAYASFADKDYKKADELLDQAAQVDANSPSLSLKRAVMAIDQGKCEVAQKHLEKVKKSDALYYERLMGRTYLCLDKPNKKKAAEHYAKADVEAKKNQANLIQAEIYTEWAPLLWDNAANLDDVVSKLSDAVQFSSQQAETIQNAAKRNLAIALFKRGWKHLKDGKSDAAVADFERAGREPARLRGDEPLAFEFSHALALLDKGDAGEAAKMFSSLAKKGNQNKYLKKPYDKIGTQFFAAYASYRGGTPEKRAEAAGQFSKLAGSASGAFAAKIKELMASSYEYVAYDQWKSGKSPDKALAAAAKSATGDLAKRIKHNQAVDNMKGSSASTFDNMNGSPPEALVNLGILYDKAGKPKEAYEAWTKAQAKGVNAKDLKKWIDAKKRIYGFN